MNLLDWPDRSRDSRHSRGSLPAGLARLAGFVLVALLILWLMDSLSDFLRPPRGEIPGVHILRQADCRVPGPSSVDTTWERCALPDYWDLRHPDLGGEGWYRVLIEAGQKRPPSGVYGLLIPSQSMNAELWINGERIEAGGAMRGRVARNWNRPLYFTVPARLIHEGNNELVIRVIGYPNASSGLGRLYWGDDRTLQEIAQKLAQRRELVTLLSFGVVTTFGLIFLFVGLRSREKAFYWFAAGSLVSGVFILDAWWMYPPLPQPVWERMAHVSIAWAQTFFFLFMVRLLRLAWPWLVRAAWINALAGLVALWVVDETHLFAVASLWEGVTLCWDLVLLLRLLKDWTLDGDRISGAFAVCMMFVFSAYLTDWLPWVSGQGVGSPYVFFLGPVGFVAGMALLLTDRLFKAYGMQQRFAAELRQALKEQAAELQEKHEKLLAYEREAAVREEQVRLSRDLHDGVGACVVHAMASATNPEVRSALEAAMDELRMLMDSVDAHADFLSMLGMLRLRLEHRLKERGIRLDWDVTGPLSWLPAGPEATMHLMRIVQEALANSLKHAAPSRLRVTVDGDRVEIADDGRGFHPDASSSFGRGLENMRWRAAQIGAELAIHSDASGTRVVVKPV